MNFRLILVLVMVSGSCFSQEPIVIRVGEKADTSAVIDGFGDEVRPPSSSFYPTHFTLETEHSLNSNFNRKVLGMGIGRALKSNFISSIDVGLRIPTKSSRSDSLQAELAARVNSHLFSMLIGYGVAHLNIGIEYACGYTNRIREGAFMGAYDMRYAPSFGIELNSPNCVIQCLYKYNSRIRNGQAEAFHNNEKTFGSVVIQVGYRISMRY